MSRHSDLVRLRHMLDHAREAASLVAGKSRTDLANTRLLQLGLVRLVEIIGEAAARVSTDGRERSPAIPWENIVGMRNKTQPPRSGMGKETEAVTLLRSRPKPSHINQGQGI